MPLVTVITIIIFLAVGLDSYASWRKHGDWLFLKIALSCGALLIISAWDHFVNRYIYTDDMARANFYAVSLLRVIIVAFVTLTVIKLYKSRR